MKKLRRVLIASAVAVTVLGTNTANAADRVLVFAAASTTNAVEQVATLYKASGKGEVVASYGSSGALSRQIASGAPADIFFSADPKWIDVLAHGGKLAPGSRTVLLANRLVLIAPKASKLTIKIAPGFDLSGALGSSRLAVGDPSNVPAGQYAQAALAHLGVWDSVRSKLAPMANVRAALTLVERGETPAGIVYSTDAAITDKVRVVDAFPADSHPRIEYEVAIVAGHDRPEVRDFLAFMRSAKARAVYDRLGFIAE